jgi:hypothetical protein
MPITFPWDTVEIVVKFPLLDLEIQRTFYAKNIREGNATYYPTFKDIQEAWDRHVELFPEGKKPTEELGKSTCRSHRSFFISTNPEWKKYPLLIESGATDADILDVFYKGVQYWVSKSPEANEITDIEQIQELWNDYLSKLPEKWKEQAGRLTSLDRWISFLPKASAPSVSVETLPYEVELRDALDNEKPLPVFFTHQRIQQYLVAQLEMFQALNLSGAKEMLKIMRSGLPLHFKFKLRLIAAIGGGQASRMAMSAYSAWHPEVKGFLAGLKQFDRLTEEKEVDSSFENFLRASGKIDDSVKNLEHHMQRYALIRDELYIMSGEGLEKSINAQRLSCVKAPLSSASPLQVFEKITEIQKFLGNSRQVVQEAMRSCPKNSTCLWEVAINPQKSLFTVLFKRWAHFSIEAGEPVKVESIFLMGVAPKETDISSCYYALRNFLGFNERNDTASLYQLKATLHGTVEEKIAQLTSKMIAYADASLIKIFFDEIEKKYPKNDGVRHVNAVQIAGDWAEYVAQLPGRLQGRARVLNSVVIEQPQHFSLQPFSYQESMQARFLGAVPAFLALQRLECQFRNTNRFNEALGSYTIVEDNHRKSATLKALQKNGESVQKFEAQILEKEISLGSKSVFHVLTSNIFKLLSGDVTELSLHACAKKYLEFLSSFLKDFIQNPEVSQALNAANISWLNELNTTLAHDFTSYVLNKLKDTPQCKYIREYLMTVFMNMGNGYLYSKDASLSEKVDAYIKFSTDGINLLIAPAINAEEVNRLEKISPVLTNLQKTTDESEREDFIRSSLEDAAAEQYKINLPFASPIPDAAFEGFSASMSDEKLREHFFISNIGYLWNIANLAHLPEKHAMALSRLRSAFVADQRFKNLDSEIQNKILVAKITPDNAPNDAAVIAAFNAILAGNDADQKRKLIAIFNDIFSRKGKAKEKLVDVFIFIIMQSENERKNLISDFRICQKNSTEKNSLREILCQRLFQAAQNNENDKLTVIATLLSNDKVVSDSAGSSNKPIMFSDQAIVDYLLKQLETFRRGIYRSGVRLSGKIGSADAIETILNGSLLLDERLQLLSYIGSGKISNEKYISRRSPELVKFYEALGCFGDVSRHNMIELFIEFLKKTDQLKSFVENMSADLFLKNYVAEKPFSHYFERWMQYSIETVELIRVNDLALIGAELTKEDVKICFAVLWDKLPALHIDLMVSTLSVFLDFIFEKFDKNDIILREAEKCIISALLIYPLYELKDDEVHQGVKNCLVNKMVSRFRAASATGNSECLNFLAETLFSRGESGVKNLQPRLSKRSEAARVLGFSTDTNERIYFEGHSSGNDEDYNEEFKETKKELSIIKYSEKDKQEKFGVYKNSLVFSLNNKRPMQKFFDFSQIRLYLTSLFNKNDLLKETVINVFESNMNFYVKLRFISAIAQGKCDSDNFDQLSEDEKILYSGLKCFSEVKFKDEVYPAFTKFLQSQETIDNNVSSADVYIQRYILIRQSLMSIPEAKLEAAGVEMSYAFRKTDIFEDPLTVFEEIDQFKKFLNENKISLVQARTVNNKGDNTRFTKFFMRWVTFSINTNQPLQLEDLMLIGVPPTLDEVVKCHDAILATANLPKERKNEFIKQLYDCYKAEIEQAPKFKAQFKLWVDFALATGEVFNPKITKTPVTAGLDACDQYINEKFNLSEIKVTAPILTSQDGSSSTDSEQPVQEPTVRIKEQQEKAFVLVLQRARSDTASTGVTATLPELINEAAISGGISNEKNLKVAELCPEDKLKKLAIALNQFTALTFSSFFLVKSIPTGMRDVIEKINNNSPAVDILQKLRTVAKDRGNQNVYGTRDGATIEAYKAINAFFTSSDSNDGPRTKTYLSDRLAASGSAAKLETIDDLIKALNDIHLEAASVIEKIDVRNTRRL